MYVAIVNMPGYMPEKDPEFFESVEEAWQYLASELERDSEGDESGRNRERAAHMIEECAKDPDGPLAGIWAHDDSNPRDSGLIYSVDRYDGPCQLNIACQYDAANDATTLADTPDLGMVPACEKCAAIYQ